MKNRIATLSIREIKNNFRRFIYLTILSFLGVTVFVGIKSTGPDMNKTLDAYYDSNNVYDIRIISTLGLTDDDISAISKVSGYKTYGLHSKDSEINIGNNTVSTIKITELNNDYNKVLLQKGRLPTKKNEIVVEDSFPNKTNIKIGDYIELDLEESDKTITSKKLKIVGTVLSPIYLTNGNGNISRGNTNIGSGRIDFYAFANKDFFNMDYYSEINVNVTNDYSTNTDEYKELINNVKSKIESIKSEREKARYNEIIKNSNKEIEEKEKDINKQFDEAKEQLDSANIQLENGLNLLISNENMLNSLKKELDNGLIKINDGKKEIENAEKQLAEGKEKLDAAVKEINSRLVDYNLDYNSLLIIKNVIEGKALTKSELISIIPQDFKYYNEFVKIINDFFEKGYDKLLRNIYIKIEKEKIIKFIPKDIENYEEICDYINNISIEKIQKAIVSYFLNSKNIEEFKKLLPKNIVGYEYLVKALDEYKITIDKIAELFNGIEKIENGYIEYNNSKSKIETGKKDLDAGYNEYINHLNEYNNAVNLLENKKGEYESGLKQYQTSLEEYNVKKFDFEKNIKDAKEKLNSIDEAKWYIYDRLDISDYMTYINCIQSIERLSLIFPIVFFAVAIFISLLSMSRMAFEDRSEIGALKSLGFSNMQIRNKYIIFSLLATVLGGILGAICGFYFISLIIYKTYGILFGIPVFIYDYNMIPIILGIGISIICICGATIITINELVKEKPTSLLRPKAPLKGRTIFLEKIKFIWNRLNFSNKVAVRNIFRYKKRIGMTVLGIVGCTVLLLAGYAIRDSIINIVDIQHKDIFKYDSVVYLNDKIESNQKSILFSNSHISDKAFASASIVRAKGRNINFVVPDDIVSFNKLISFIEKGTEKELVLENNKILVTSKLAKTLHLKVNDIFEFTDKNDKTYKFKINGIVQNYLGDYIFMNKNTYEKYIGDYKISVAYIKYDDFNNIEIVSEKILENENVLGVVSIKLTFEAIANVFKSLDIVVIILVVFSGTLSLVVLYNLSHINISERQREIATLKVLGFNHMEIDSYIIKEEILITIIGIIIGLLVGTWFASIIVEVIEIDLAEFIKQISVISYIKTFGFMILFSIIVNIRVHFILKKVDMIESLKSVE